MSNTNRGSPQRVNERQRGLSRLSMLTTVLGAASVAATGAVAWAAHAAAQAAVHASSPRHATSPRSTGDDQPTATPHREHRTRPSSRPTSQATNPPAYSPAPPVTTSSGS